jgi:hypothetical protein
MWRPGKHRSALLLLLSSDDETTRLLVNALAETADVISEVWHEDL